MFVFVIKNIRIKKNMTIYRLSKITGINRAYLTQLENNKKFNPSLATMYKIAHALECKIDDLVYKINLAVIKVNVVQILRKRLLCRVHIQAHNFTNQLP